MDIIQLFQFRHPENSTGFFSELSCFVLSHLRLSAFYRQPELFTSEQGAEILIDELKLKFNSVTVLPVRTSEMSALDSFDACANRTRPFLYVGQSIIVNRKIQEEHLLPELLINYINTNHGYSYFQNRSLQNRLKSTDQTPTENDLVNSMNLDVRGGNDFHMWTAYLDFAQQFLDDHRSDRLKAENVEFLLNTSLLTEFCRLHGKKIEFLTKDSEHTHTLKSDTFQWSSDSAAGYSKIPKRLLVHPEIFSLALKTIRDENVDVYGAIKGYYQKTRPKSYIAGGEPLVKRTNFPLTCLALERFFNQTVSAEASAVQIWALIQQRAAPSPPSDFVILIKDAFKYERMKQRLARANVARARKAAGRKRVSTQGDEISLALGVSVISTRWNWKLGLKLDELFSLKVFYNSTIPSSRFETLFIFDATMQEVNELSVGNFDYLILKSFAKGRDLQSGVSKIIKGFDLNDRKQRAGEISSAIEAGIKRLLKRNLLIQGK